MARVRCTAVPSRPTEFLDVTSVTLDELRQLVPPCAAAFHAPMAAWRAALRTLGDAPARALTALAQRLGG